ncbi:Tetratricopeptide repeat-containing protein [Fibrobacter sp. UWT2]|uniref:tetratricopeptide repeat protein n=1 Tax=Fibrobacter sp. UWT2 TaxID=1896224 RepID=UPI0009172CEE|nr:tetratricopeptide repeat protein [Fibrobacter sp. UWT2]SHL23150.1 Tetratricopeptide repeat-containing protein [Fibrobacter sp. UWT2]
MLRRVCYIGVILFSLLLMSCVNDDIKRGNDALRIGDYERAIANFSKALDVEPANRDARYGLALSYFAEAEQTDRFKDSSFVRWSRTAREFKILYGLDSSGSIDANYSTCLFYLARATLNHDASANVLPLLDKSIQLDSLNYFSYNLKGLILAQSNAHADLNSAKNIFIHIVTREPQFISAYINLGNIYWEEGDIESAWDTWSAGLEKAPTNRSLIHWTQVAEDSLKSMVLSGRL